MDGERVSQRERPRTVEGEEVAEHEGKRSWETGQSRRRGGRVEGANQVGGEGKTGGGPSNVSQASFLRAGEAELTGNGLPDWRLGVGRAGLEQGDEVSDGRPGC